MGRTLAAALVAPILGVLGVLAGCASPTAAPGALPPGAGAPPTITTRGVGTVVGTPDTLTVTLGVVTRAASAADALTDDNTRTSALLDVLRAHGIADEDLRTSGLSIAATSGPDGRITGYEVGNEVTATLHDLAGAGGLVDAAARSAGDAVRVRQIDFGLTDDGQPRARTRADAVGQAVAQARQLADAAHVALGPILSITEVTAAQPPVPAARESAAAPVAIEPGVQDVSVTVEVVHALDT